MKDYRLVGDDLLISNNKAGYSRYLEITRDFGLEINQHKTLVSETAPHTIEFARNYIIDGVRVNPLPFGIAFAWLTDQVPTETVIWSLRLNLNHTNLLKIIETLEPSLSVGRRLIFYYYLYKADIAPENLVQDYLMKEPRLKAFKISTLKLVKEIAMKHENTKT